MNCPSRTDEILGDDGRNQNPPSLSGDLTTRQDLNGISNLRVQRDHISDPSTEEIGEAKSRESYCNNATKQNKSAEFSECSGSLEHEKGHFECAGGHVRGESAKQTSHVIGSRPIRQLVKAQSQTWEVLRKFGSFIGPGFLVGVAYIDPGNYSTDVSAGASTTFGLLFIVLISNLMAIVLQSLAIRLGTVTGLNLAEHCRATLPAWLNIILYLMAEAAIIATDIAEVIGSAIALNLLLKIPLVAGCAITLVDVLIILIFYNPNGSMKRLRAFEFFVVALVLGVTICFCIQLSLIRNATVGEVFKGYLPSSTLIKGQGLYLSCGIVGATVMPHGLYLGSGIVQSRLHEFDAVVGNDSHPVTPPIACVDEKTTYRPSLAAIRSCLNYSIVELVLSLSIFALFVNSAILIVAGASLSSTPSAVNADLFSIHDLLSKSLAPAAGTIFALALLLSGTSAGIVCTIAGQMVSEGALNWKTSPWKRRLVTRSISITPSIIVAGAVGKEGLSSALNGSQVALSVILPFVSAPLIYFTCRNKYMTVTEGSANGGEHDLGALAAAGNEIAAARPAHAVKMRNSPIIAVLGVIIWLVLVVMNIANLVLVGLGHS